MGLPKKIIHPYLPPSVCPTCNLLVQQPCLACQLKAMGCKARLSDRPIRPRPVPEDYGDAPSPEDVLIRSQEVQRDWDKETERSRRTGTSIEQPYELPGVDTAALGGRKRPGKT